MTEHESLVGSFEQHRTHLRGVAYRMLGSLSEADDAVQEAWLRLSRADTSAVENLRGWLTTVIARVCLDMLRSRKTRREDSLETQTLAKGHEPSANNDAESERAMADNVGMALLVVLETLAPAERVAFVLHDVFAVPFEQIAPITGRSESATRQLASRARRRVQGASTATDPELSVQRSVVDAFVAALRSGDIAGLVALLDPEVVVRADFGGQTREVRGAENWAKGAVAFPQLAQLVEPALVDGAVGLVFAPRGRLVRVVQFTFEAGKIMRIDVVTQKERLAQLELGVLGD